MQIPVFCHASCCWMSCLPVCNMVTFTSIIILSSTLTPPLHDFYSSLIFYRVTFNLLYFLCHSMAMFILILFTKIYKYCCRKQSWKDRLFIEGDDNDMRYQMILPVPNSNVQLPRPFSDSRGQKLEFWPIAVSKWI